MRYRHLNLRKFYRSRRQKQNEPNIYPGRRQFVKAMGLGALAWNPLIDSFKLLEQNKLSIRTKNNQLRVYLNRKLVWEISNRYFEPGYSLSCNQKRNSYLIKANGLRFKNTNLLFSFNTFISQQNSGWHCRFYIPEYNMAWRGNFTDWLRKESILESRLNFNNEVISRFISDRIIASGEFHLKMSPNWNWQLSSKNNVKLFVNDIEYSTGNLNILPRYYNNQNFLKPGSNPISVVSLPEFGGWEKFTKHIHLAEGSLQSTGKTRPNLFVASSTSNQDKMFWIESGESSILFKPKIVTDSPVKLGQFFYYAEYLNTQKVNTYLSANLPDEPTWFSNTLGAFKIEKDDQYPVLEAAGTNHYFDKINFEPRLRAFKPKITNAITLSGDYQDPVKVKIVQPKTQRTLTTTSKSGEQTESSNNTSRDQDPQRPQKKVTVQRKPVQQKPIRDVSKKKPNITVDFNKIKFKPKRALTIHVLRPEDLVQLEFTFHNFSFTNKEQTSFLELDNNKKPGVIVIKFPTQHTLEEAYYETTKIKDDDELNPVDKGVELPARHIRARKSRLVYELPAGSEGFPLIMEELLDWSKFKLRVHPRAWIKIPSIKRIGKPSRVINDKRTIVQPNKNLKYLETPTTEYGIKLAQKSRIKANRLDVYQENQIGKVIQPETVPTIKQSFSAKAIKKIQLAVGPVPALSTSIEAPTLMYISPNQTNDFYHKTDVHFRDVKEMKVNTQVLNSQLRVLDPLSTTQGEITELWHTRLGVKLKNGKTSGTALSHFKTIRALWADDAKMNYKALVDRNQPFMASLDANNRHKLVHTTSNYTLGFEPSPVPVNDLMLTTLGSYLDWHAFFDVPSPQDDALNIIEWEHIATLGRDHFVKVVEEGYLFPFGHRAAIVKITERKFHQQTKSAVNRQRMFVVVLEKELLYSRNDTKGKFIEFPFQAIRIETNATPNIDDPQNSTLESFSENAGSNALYNFYIHVATKPFLFDLVATDKEGRDQAFRMPLVFIENMVARSKTYIEDVIKVYTGKQNNNLNKKYNETGFNNQEVAFAEFLVDGDTSFETETIKFGAQLYLAKGAGQIQFHPNMVEAKVFIEQVSELTGSRDPAIIGLEDDENDGGVFARVTSNNVVDFTGGSDKAGGFLAPNMGISGLSKLQGPISGKLDDLKDLKFIPKEFFEAFDDLPVGKIFGVIKIFDLLLGNSQPFDLGGTFDDMKNAVKNIRDEIDNIKNEILYLENLAQEAQEAVEDQIDELKQTIKDKVNELLQTLTDSIPRIPNLKAFLTEEAFHVEYKWQPELESDEISIIPGLLQVLVDNPSTALSITTKLVKPFDANKPAALNGLARFEKFGVDIVPLLAIHFNYLEFRTGSSEKTDVKVDIDPDKAIEFKGVLNFVNNLQSIIPTNGFSDSGPYIDLKPTGVTAGFDIAIPNVEVGICMISNISLGANVTLPFTGAPLTMGFNFCRRENPFMLTISCFGGGGYFMMTSTLQGIQSIEAAFEFGAAMSLNVGVASGGVSAMGGFYYKMEIVEGVEETTLSGYLRLNGHLSILGLISLSLEFYLAFIAVLYQGKVQKMEGVATLKVKVEVLFFSKTVKVTVRRELKGADADPKFAEMIEADDWQEYCLAFAS